MIIIDILIILFILTWLTVGISVITNYIKHNVLTAPTKGKAHVNPAKNLT